MIYHNLLEKQLRNHHHLLEKRDLDPLLAEINSTYIEADKDRTRTDRAINLMVEELEEVNKSLTQQVETRTSELKSIELLLESTMQNAEQGIFIIDENEQIQLCNNRAMEMLDIPAEFIAKKPFYKELLQFHVENGEYKHLSEEFMKFVLGGGIKDSPPLYERKRPNGKIMEVRTVLLKNGGAMRVFSDITERKITEENVKIAERQYRSLFENTLIGLYRADIDGKITKINRILCNWHGIENEEDFLNSNHTGQRRLRDYIDENREKEFRYLLFNDGKITDFISEVRNHHTGKAMWISETAWLVKDKRGNPISYDGTVTDITERIHNQSRISFLALHDTLTGLPNRAYLLDKLDEMLRNNETDVAVHFIDLDRFKIVNDTYGHATGDELLKQVAKRLNACIRRGDFIARLGGDEFAIIQSNAYDQKEMAALAKRVIKLVAGNYKLGRHKANIGASIGISCVRDVGNNAQELLKTADAALYRAKGDGRGNYKFFDPEINSELQKRRFMETELRQAVKRKQIRVAYQPIIDIKTNDIYGYEALARWSHPKLGDVPPDIFIQLAEECGEIDKIGEFIIHEACQEIAKASKKLNISINVSAVQFRSYQFLNTVLQTLSQTHLRPEQLTLEMTETALISNPSLTGDIITGLQNLGVKVSLDDFGSGNASLSYLQKYKFDKIKIDRSYISGTENLAMNKAILNAVTSLGRDLHIEIIAEGIETQEQHEKVKEQGCDYGQGWLYGKAKFANEWEELSQEKLRRVA